MNLLDFQAREERPIEEAVAAAVQFMNEGVSNGGSR